MTGNWRRWATAHAALLGELYSGLWFTTSVTSAAFLSGLSAVLFVLSTFLLWAVTRYSRRYMAGDPGHARFTAWLCVTGTCVFTLVLAQKLIVFAAAWCATSLSLDRLLQFYRDRPAAVLAARKKFLISRLADLCLVSAIGLAWFEFGTWDFARLFRAVDIMAGASIDQSAAPTMWIAVLLALGALLMSAQFPFHTWVPDTMETPTPVSALMHAGIINAGGILVIRLSPVLALSSAAMTILTVAGVFTAVFAGVVMLTQASIKRSLAFSTVAQMGFMMFECGLGAFHMALIHLVSHSVFKAYAFLSSGRAVRAREHQARRAARPAAVLSGLSAGAICAILTYLATGAAPVHPELKVIFALAVAQMLWNFWSASGLAWRVPAGVAIAGCVTAVYCVMERVGSAVVKPFDGHGGVAGYLTVAAFSAMALAESQLPRLASSRWLRNLWVHARNGFYLNTLANRFTMVVWPVETSRVGDQMAASMTFRENANTTLRNGTREAIAAACARVAPLWPLESFVAVNPFLGLSAMEFSEAIRLLEKTAHGSLMLSADDYCRKLHCGEITAKHVIAALGRLGLPEPQGDPVVWLDRQLSVSGQCERLLTVADRLDRASGTNWASFVVDEISKWCASYFDEGQSVWTMPWRDLPLYSAWKRAAEIDANPELVGVPSFRRFVQALPECSTATIEKVLESLAVPSELAPDFLHRQLMSVPGWSAFAAYRDWRNGGRQTVADVLAIRLAYDGALLPLDPDWRVEVVNQASGFTEAKYIAQVATELAVASRIAVGMSAAKRPRSGRKALQAVFCIDVRSEVYRRALEAQSDEIATVGFAGFFGMPIQLGKDALCPVLVDPKYELDKQQPARSWNAASLWNSVKTSAVACFPAVELGGVGFVAGMARQFFRGNSRRPATKFGWNIPLNERANLAAVALKNMSLDVNLLAPVVLFCGHGARTENNPYAASLDCGACGGHSGELNARFAAALMNDQDVRAELKRRGIPIPDDTLFLAALHETTTDDITLFDAENVNPETIARVRGWLHDASTWARKERATADGASEREIRRRAADWSEVRPEWGSAGNAAFIAAPRWRTKALNLGGRVFLHDYDAAKDTDGSVLTLILTAPVVIASWINLQYYGSTVDNRLFGSGNKVLHNVVGCFGVWEGNAGDLRTGLPLQSLHNGHRWMHEPLRLQVLIEAPRDRISRVLNQHESIRNLSDGGWIQLLAIEANSTFLYRGAFEWSKMHEQREPYIKSRWVADEAPSRRGKPRQRLSPGTAPRSTPTGLPGLLLDGRSLGEEF